MRASYDTDRTQVAAHPSSTEHLNTLTEKKTNMSDIEHASNAHPQLGQTTSKRQQSEDRFDDNVIERELANNRENNVDGKDLEKGDQVGDDEGATEPEQTEKDPNLIEWDGPDDPENPMNWPKTKKWIVTLTLGFMTLCVTFASSVFSNATVPVANLFGVSTEVTTLGTSLFVLGFALGPLVSVSSPCIRHLLMCSDMGTRIRDLRTETPIILRILMFRNLPDTGCRGTKLVYDYALSIPWRLLWLRSVSNRRGDVGGFLGSG